MVRLSSIVFDARNSITVILGESFSTFTIGRLWIHDRDFSDNYDKVASIYFLLVSCDGRATAVPMDRRIVRPSQAVASVWGNLTYWKHFVVTVVVKNLIKLSTVLLFSCNLLFYDSMFSYVLRLETANKRSQLSGLNERSYPCNMQYLCPMSDESSHIVASYQFS